MRKITLLFILSLILKVALAQTYPILFVVNDGTYPMENAAVVIGTDTIYTDVNGEAMFTDMAAATYSYTVEASGYHPGSGSVTVVDQQVVEVVSLDLITYTVVCQLAGGDPPVNIYGKIVFNGEERTQYGMALPFPTWENVPPGTYEFAVTADYYQDSTGTLTVVDQDIWTTIVLKTVTETKSVTFMVDDGTYGINGASVTFDGTTQTTDIFGQITFEDYLVGQTYDYTVSAPGFVDATGSVELIDQDVYEYITLAPVTYTTTFTVDDGTNPIAGAAVIIDTDTIYTDASGNAIFDLPEGTHNYKIKAAGYNNATGTVTLVDQAITEAVSLSTAIYYTLTFTVNDGTNPITGAKVTMDNTTLVTNASGNAVFDNILADTYSYTVAADGYDNYTGTTTVIDQNVSEIVSMDLTTYAVTFIIDDGTDPIAGADVTMSGTTLTTNTSGEVIFTGTAPGSYSYTVMATAYDNATGSVVIVDTDISKTVSLSLTTYTVTFVVDDGTNPLEGADVTMNGTTLITNASGEVIFAETLPGSYSYTVAATDYDNATGNVDVVDTDITDTISLSLTTYNVTFVVNDGTNPIEGADVTMDGTTLTTNASGKVIFTENLPGNYSYTIVATGYESANGNIDVVNADITELVSLSLAIYSVTFDVDDGINAIGGADVTMNGTTLTTDAYGIAVFTDIIPGNYSYTVLGIGYNNATGSIDVVDTDITETVTLNLSTGIESMESEKMILYPNPTLGEINIILPETFQNEATITVMNLIGIVVKEIKVNIGNTHVINISDLPGGIYFLNISNRDYDFLEKIIKK